MAKSSSRAAWFKMFLHNKSLIDAVSDEAAGRALKAALHYFDTGELVELDALSKAVFAALKPYIDEAFADFQATSEKNRQNVRKRWANQGLSNDTNGYHSLPNDTKNTEAEAEADADAEAETEGEWNKAAKPPHNRFFPPSVDEVREYCKERGNNVDPERFVDYYTANGWMVGKSKMKDWKSAVRTWEKNKFSNERSDTKNGISKGNSLENAEADYSGPEFCTGIYL